MKKLFNLFKIMKNLFSRKKMAEKDTEVLKITKEKIPPHRIGGGNFMPSRLNTALYKKRKKNKIQGMSRNVNHKKAA